MTRVESVEVRTLSMPLAVPYWSMISTIHALETIVVEVRASDGRSGFGEAAIYTGYTDETPEGGFRFCSEQAQRLLGLHLDEAIATLAVHRRGNSHAVSCLVSAMEMAQVHPALAPREEERMLPLLAPVHAMELAEVPAEIEALLAEGYRTLKVKVGANVDADLRRVALIQRVVQGRAGIRLDANQGYSRADGCRFAAALDPSGIELFEQACAAEDWDAAVAVKQVSTVPMMLDESIFGEREIERAAELRAASYIKLKLVKVAGVAWLRDGLGLIRRLGMRPVLGNGVATEIGCWMEACASDGLLDNASEMNGYLKPKARLFRNPLPFAEGNMIIPAGYFPEIDRDALERVSTRVERIAPAVVRGTSR